MLGIQTDGRKDILGVWIGENESSKFWLQVMNDLKNCGIKDVYVFCVDGLKGFRETVRKATGELDIQATSVLVGWFLHKILWGAFFFGAISNLINRCSL